MINEREIRQNFRLWQYYIIIGVISFITVFFLPFIGSTVGLKWVLPTNVVGWVVYIVSKLLVAVVNILLFHCFMQQAKVNVKDDPKYKEANDILKRCGFLNKWAPRGPVEWQKLQYKRKGIWIAIGSLITAIGLSQALLVFDWVMMVSYVVIIIFGIIFGVLQLNAAEQYWTDEYYDYAKMVEREMALAEKEST